MPKIENNNLKKNNNRAGFTLIEMLAVVVLLGLLIALLFPAISKYIINTKSETYELYEETMEKSAKNMMSECVEKNDTTCIPSSGKTKKISLSELIATGYSDKLRDPNDSNKDCDKFRSFVAVNNRGNNTVDLEYTVCLVCGDYESEKCGSIPPAPTPTCTDSENPVCGSTTGESTIWTNKDKTITVGCSDDCSECVQDVFSKKVDTDTKTTTIEIADNEGKTTACTVNAYVDKTKPTCTLEVVGNLGTNGWYTDGSVPKVLLKTKNDNLSGVSTYGLGTSKLIYDFNKKTEYEVREGITTVYGYVMDNAGNVGTCNVEIKYDATPPAVKTVDYGYVVYPKADIATVSGKKITLNSITSEYGNIYGVYIYMKNGNGGHATIKNNTTTLGTVTIPTDTSKARLYFAKGLYSKLSIEFASTTEINNISRIEVLTRDGTAGYYTNKNVTLYINSTDSVSGKAKYSFNGGVTLQDDNFKTYEKNTVVVVGVTDGAGNMGELVTKTIDNIDKVQPECTITVGSSTVVTHDNNFYWEDVPIVLSKDDAPETTDYAKSGTRHFGLVDKNELTYNDIVNSKQTKDTLGTEWHGYVIDRAGNTNTCVASVKKDSQDPECNLKLTGTKGLDNWYVSTTVDVTFDYYRDVNKDSVQSGLAAYDITTSSTPSYNNSNKKTQTADTTSVTYYGYVKDKAGRTKSCSVTFKKDSTKPTCEITSSGNQGQNNWYIGNVTITLTPGDATSLVNSYDLTESSTASYNGTSQIVLKTDVVSKTYYGYVKDNAGNTNSCSHTVKRDTSKPTCTLGLDGTKGSNNWYTTDVTVKFDPKNDTTSGIAHFQIDKSSSVPSTYDDTATKKQTADTTSVTYYGHLIDNAGHTNSCSVTFKKDATKPTCSITSTGTKGENNWYTGNATITMTTSDATSLVAGYDMTTTNSATYGGTSQIVLKTDTSGTTYYGFVKDNAGLTNTCSHSVKRDTANPSCTLALEGDSIVIEDWWSGPVKVKFNSKTDATSGIASFQIDKTNANPSSYDGVATKIQTEDTVGVTYYGHVKDYAGHTSSCSKFFKQDSVAPTCNIVIASGTKGDNNWYVTNVKLEMRDKSDANGTVHSGVYEYGVGPTEQYDMSTTKTCSTDGSSITYGCYVEDKAGNKGSKTITFKRDATAPTCLNHITQDYHPDGISGSIDCSDSTSGCATGYSGISFTNLTSNRRTTVKDKAGNENTLCGVDVLTDLRYYKKTCNKYKKCATEDCGVLQYNECEHKDCGKTNVWSWTGCNAEEDARWGCAKNISPNGDIITTWPVYCKGTLTCATEECACKKDTYHNKKCRTEACGVESYKSCETADCGCKTWGNWGTELLESCGGSPNTTQCSSVIVYYYFWGQYHP